MGEASAHNLAGLGNQDAADLDASLRSSQGVNAFRAALCVCQVKAGLPELVAHGSCPIQSNASVKDSCTARNVDARSAKLTPDVMDGSRVMKQTLDVMTWCKFLAAPHTLG